MDNIIDAPFLEGYMQSAPVEKIAVLLDRLPRQNIACAPWKEFSSRVEASFTVAHGNDAVFVKFFVKEGVLRSTYIGPNDPVYKDSCVEFFIGFEQEAEYYNFEFNCAGTCLAGFGSGRERRLLPKAAIEEIKHHTLIKNGDSESLIQWELTLIIPVKAFIHHQFTAMRGIKSRVNFFKCGDDLPEPHYLCWSNINSAVPNFHLPEFFGILSFSG
jgi:hypothetical protein